MTCPNDDELAAFTDGELAENRARAVRVHLEGCPRCSADAGEIARIGAHLRAPLPNALRGCSAEAFADGVLANLDRARVTRGPSARLTWLALLAAAAAVPLAVAASHRGERGAPAPSSEWAARGGAASGEAVKRTLVRFGRVSGASSFEPLTEGAQLDAEALIGAEVGGTEGPPRYLLAFLVDAAGDRHWIYPAYEIGAPPPFAQALPATAAPRVLGSVVRLDHPAPGAAQLFAIVLPRVESVDDVEKAPREQLTRDELARRYAGALVVNVGVEVR